MLRSVRVLALALLAVLVGSSAAQAQASKFLYVGGGLTMPMGDYKDYAKTGYMADVGLGTNVGSGGKLFAFVDGFYGKNNHKDVDGESTTLMGGGLNLGIQSSGSSARVYGYVGGGMQRHKFNSDNTTDDDSETKPFGRGAVGISLGSGKTTFWAEVGWLQGFGADDGNTGYMPIMAGISIGW